MNVWGKFFLLLVAISGLLVGCTAPKTPDPTPTANPATATVTQTVPTLQPSATPTIVLTPEPPLQTTGPYLVYFRQIGEKQQLVLMDLDGIGRKVISLPSENPVYSWFISPDGKWLAYYLGSAEKEKTSDLTLHLLNLQTGESRLVSKLLSQDYPDNFIQAAKELNEPGINANSLQQVFISGITTSLGWSPNGQYLAFAGQMDGLSSDIYLYDLAKGSIRRLTHGQDEVLGIDWSPDGKWILSSSEKQISEGSGYIEDAIALDGSAITALPYRTGNFWGWYNEYTYLDCNAENGPGNYDLRSVDIRTGKVIKIWEGALHSFVFDAEKAKGIVFAITRTWPPKTEDKGWLSGTYLVNMLDGRATKLGHAYDSNISFFGLGNRRFLTRYRDENKTYFINADGKFFPADPEIDNVSASPDKQLWISIGKTLKIFNADDTLVADLDLPFTTPEDHEFGQHNGLDTIWNPDSSGFFIALDKNLYYCDLASKEIRLVETNLALDRNIIFTASDEKP